MSREENVSNKYDASILEEWYCLINSRDVYLLNVDESSVGFNNLHYPCQYLTETSSLC